MLRQILGRGRKEGQRAAPEDPGELSSGVDDIIATFDGTAEAGCPEQGPRADANQRSSGGCAHPLPEQRPPARPGLPPLRAQSLPPITPGSHLRTAPHAAPRSQQSCGERDSLSHRPGGQAPPDPWRGDSGQGLPRVWPGPPAEKLLDRLLPGRSRHQDVPGPPHLPHLPTPSAGGSAPSSWSWQRGDLSQVLLRNQATQPGGRGQSHVGHQSPSFLRPRIRGVQAAGPSAFYLPSPQSKSE